MNHSNPLNASTIGYCADSLTLQYRHLPPNVIHENNGILSYQANLWLQVMQCEDVFTNSSPLGIRYIKTLQKLPMQMPRSVIMTYANVVNPKSAIADVKSIINQAFLIPFSSVVEYIVIRLTGASGRYLYIFSPS
jgi:hypothetical protein